MARKERLREELDDRMLPRDRRVQQVKGEIDVSDLDADELKNLRDEQVTNLNENELDQLDAAEGVAQDTDEETELLPVKKLNRDLEDENERIESGEGE